MTTFGTSTILDGLEYTGANGAAQAGNWTYQSLQQRARIGRLLCAGVPEHQRRRQRGQPGPWRHVPAPERPADRRPVAELGRALQNGSTLGTDLDFVYGLDYISTNPRTGNTINGRNEDIDDVKEIGG